MSWRAVYCVPTRELNARDHLADAGIEVFCPSESVVRRYAVPGRPGRFRAKRVDVALFAPYLFADTDEFLAVCRTPGVLSVVSAAGRPLVVPDRVIERLKAAADDAGHIEGDVSKPSFWFEGRAGDSFVFGSGSPLAGLIGRIASLATLDETGELSVWISMFGGERRVDIPLGVVGTITRKEPDRHRIGRGGAAAITPAG